MLGKAAPAYYIWRNGCEWSAFFNVNWYHSCLVFLLLLQQQQQQQHKMPFERINTVYSILLYPIKMRCLSCVMSRGEAGKMRRVYPSMKSQLCLPHTICEKNELNLVSKWQQGTLCDRYEEQFFLKNTSFVFLLNHLLDTEGVYSQTVKVCNKKYHTHETSDVICSRKCRVMLRGTDDEMSCSEGDFSCLLGSKGLSSHKWHGQN